jgi:predicted nucleic acid-binding protein
VTAYCFDTRNVQHFGRVPGLVVENWIGGM